MNFNTLAKDLNKIIDWYIQLPPQLKPDEQENANWLASLFVERRAELATVFESHNPRLLHTTLNGMKSLLTNRNTGSIVSLRYHPELEEKSWELLQQLNELSRDMAAFVGSNPVYGQSEDSDGSEMVNAAKLLVEAK